MSKHKKINSSQKSNVVSGNTVNKPSIWDTLKNIYTHEYKKQFIFIILLTLFSILSIVFTYVETGDFTRRDVTLKGGISLTINTGYTDINGLEKYLSDKFPKSSINVRTIESGGTANGIIIEASDVSEQELIAAASDKIGPISKNNYSIETMGSSLGQSFSREIFIALFLAFFCMGLVFQFYFRNIYGTIAALLSAFLDIFVTLGIMNLIGLRLTAGGIAAYLMLIGYSVDTSILLSTKLLKEKKDDVNKALFGAMKTGLTMSFSGIAATGLSYLFTNNVVLKQIMFILIVGLFVDIVSTWLGNVALLRIYLEKKHVKD